MSPRASSRQGDLFGRISPRVEQPAPFSSASPASLPLERRQLLEWQERLAAYQAPLWAAAAPEEAEQAHLFAGLTEADSPASPAPPEALAQT
ncbi:MAG: hypothetical protein ACK5CQ_03340, partial [Cyanobacteriota bacterium]